METQNRSAVLCPECEVGHLRRRQVTYFAWLGPEVVTVPDFPAWVCDVCGYREYDSHAIRRLSVLLDPDFGAFPPDVPGSGAQNRRSGLGART
ncbi:MAG: YgiT-type zinc finger protein [Anaerolineaceae bacterium]|nr:YgiT-type zinc finger protein [Anaerolineaceae bacterium]